MQITKEEFKKELEQKLDSQFAVDVKHASLGELYSALSNVVRDGYAPDWRKTRIEEAHEGKKQVYYFSIEFYLVRFYAAIF